MGGKIEVQETILEAFYLCQAIFAPPVKVAPKARAMPAIPQIRHCMPNNVYHAKQL